MGMTNAHSRTPITGGAGLAPHPAPTQQAAPTQHPAPTLSPLPSPAASGAVPAAPVLVGRGLQHRYDTSSTPALQGVDLTIIAGESIAVMGPSGCGKTTLLHCLAGIIRPTNGQVQLRGTDLAQLSDARRTRLRRSDFGFVFQDGQLLPELTAEENVMLPHMLAGTSRSAGSQSARQWLDALGLGHLTGRRPGQLSGGQAQRVAIARALAGSPAVVFADEPTGALDQATEYTVLDLLVGATARTGAALVLVTHDPGVARACSRTVHMQDGQIIAEHQRPTGER